MGRVYSLLGYHERAKDLNQKAFDARKGLGFSYRQALSATSLATVWNNAGQPQQAIRFIDDALHEFRNAEAERGIGLGLITMGTIQRKQAEIWREQDEPAAQAIRYTDTAETNLRDAVRIFSEIVQEPIRLVQAYNELGSCYRARHFILKHITDTTPRYLESTLRLGVATYKRAIEYALQGSYYIEELDTLQDLAVLFFRDDKFLEAKEQLQQIRKKIPAKYQIRKRIGVTDIPLEERVDAYYKLMGQVEMLEGAIVYRQGVLDAKKLNPLSAVPLNDSVYKQTVAYYVLADIYFRYYSGEPYALERTHGRMYKRFEHCSIELVREITGQFIPQMLREYQLPEDSAKGLFADVFGVFN
jgi:tetratricopeptide (TPR) repeat protein